MDPEVGDPLGARQDRAGRVSREIVPFAVGEQVVPEGHGALLRLEREAEVREHCVAAKLHVGLVHKQGRDPVAGAEARERVLLLAAREVEVRPFKRV